MPTVNYYCPKSVKACALRVTRLLPSGVPEDPLTVGRTWQGSGFMELSLNPDYEDSSETVIRNPGGNVAIIHKDFDVLKGFEVNLKLCGLPVAIGLLGWNPLLTYDEGTDVVDINGWALNDDLGEPCLPPSMLEVWSKNVGEIPGLTDCGRWIHWVLPWTHDWTLKSSITFSADAVEIELGGYARSNPWWFPAFPGSDFASYGVTGLPTGPPPTILPSEVTTPDPWTLTDWQTIRDSGPLAYKGVTSLPEPLDDCTTIPSSDDPCASQIGFRDGPFDPDGSGLVPSPPYYAESLFPWA